MSDSTVGSIAPSVAAPMCDCRSSVSTERQGSRRCGPRAPSFARSAHATHRRGSGSTVAAGERVTCFRRKTSSHIRYQLPSHKPAADPFHSLQCRIQGRSSRSRGDTQLLGPEPCQIPDWIAAVLPRRIAQETAVGEASSTSRRVPRQGRGLAHASCSRGAVAWRPMAEMRRDSRWAPCDAPKLRHVVTLAFPRRAVASVPRSGAPPADAGT